MKKVLFLRKKLAGENSMEELAYNLVKHIPDMELCVLPHYSTTIKGMIKNSIYACKHQGDVNHIFSIRESYLSLFIGGRKIVTCHDVGTLKSLSFCGQIAARLLWLYLPSFFWNVCTCISQQTSDELSAIIPWRKKNIRIVPNPVNPMFVYTPKLFGNPPVILHVGTARRKNLLNVIKALKGLNCKLVIVGILFPEQQEALNCVSYPYEVYSDLSTESLVEQYVKADIISFPSSYEGFGMPAIEANTVGRVLVAGDIPVLHEVAQDAACFVNPSDVSMLHKSFERIINDEEYRNELCKKGYLNSKRFSIEKLSRQYMLLYKK